MKVLIIIVFDNFIVLVSGVSIGIDNIVKLDVDGIKIFKNVKINNIIIENKFLFILVIILDE